MGGKTGLTLSTKDDFVLYMVKNAHLVIFTAFAIRDTDGSFPISTQIVSGTPQIRPNLCFLALGNPPPAMANRIHFRSCSCPCHHCITGRLDSCVNGGFVPQWNSELLTFRNPNPPISQARHSANIRTKLETFRRRRADIPSFYCLAWRANVQQPWLTILHMSNLPVGRNTVRCHVLPLNSAAANNFGHCLCELPRNLCPDTQEACACANFHAQDFPIENILEVAVYVENRQWKNHLGRVRGQPQGANFELMDLPSNKPNDAMFHNYARKRLQFFNDFFTV